VKKADIKIGSVYEVRVGRKLTEVRVDEIRDDTDRMPYYRSEHILIKATNLSTGRKVVLRSYEEFLAEVEGVTCEEG